MILNESLNSRAFSKVYLIKREFTLVRSYIISYKVILYSSREKPQAPIGYLRFPLDMFEFITSQDQP